MTRTGQHQRCISALAIGAMFVTAVIGTPMVGAQTYTVLHRFKGSPTDGAYPFGPLTGDSAGNLYGTTGSGGASNAGVVFKLAKAGEILLYSFTGGEDGKDPNGVIRDLAGNLYGATYAGGASGYGAVFELDRTGTETVLYSFRGGADGALPNGGMVQDPAGNLYGTTVSGGLFLCSGYGGSGGGPCGVVFKVDTAGTEEVLYSFTGGADGWEPSAGPIGDSAGNLYGTDYINYGVCCGVVYKLDDTGKFTVLYTFLGGADGANPAASLIRDSAGNFYGTTVHGGIDGDDCSIPFQTGCGVVFKLDTTGTETVLYSFTGGADGANPSAGLIRDAAGNLYGTTPNGGIFNSTCTAGCGVVFKLDTAGKETVLYSFTGGADGAYPYALIRGPAGNFYGTAYNGGIVNSTCTSGCGVLFMLQP